jgi:hypothetical protein
VPGLMWALTGTVGVGAVGRLQHTGPGSTSTLSVLCMDSTYDVLQALEVCQLRYTPT